MRPRVLTRWRWKGRTGANSTDTAFFLARWCLGKVPGGAPFSQLHKGIGSITRTGQIMQVYKPKQIQTKQRQQQIPNCGGREDETDARAVRPNSLARCIEWAGSRPKKCERLHRGRRGAQGRWNERMKGGKENHILGWRPSEDLKLAGCPRFVEPKQLEQIWVLVKSRVPEFVEPKQLEQTRVLVKHARLTAKRS